MKNRGVLNSVSHIKEGLKISAAALESFISEVLSGAGVRGDIAAHVIKGLIQTSLRGVDSHGIRLLPHYIRGVQGGRINPDPHYRFTRTSPSTALLDADHTFGHAAGMEAAGRAMELAREAGTGVVAIYNSTHFGAAAYYALEIARHDMIGMAFSNTDALLKTYGGKRPFLGNNPIAFAAPCKGEEPFCLDMATSVVTFNKIRQLKEKSLPAPPGVGATKDGIDSTDPNEISTLLPIGGYKGYCLSMMIEILCSLLTGMPYGPHIPKMFEAPMNAKRKLGQFVIAIRIDCFQEIAHFKDRLSSMMNELRGEPPMDEDTPIMVAGDPEKKSKLERSKSGIPLTQEIFEFLLKEGMNYGLDLNSYLRSA